MTQNVTERTLRCCRTFFKVMNNIKWKEYIQFIEHYCIKINGVRFRLVLNPVVHE